MKILVTGGSGFIGSNFIEFLLQNSGESEIEVSNLDKRTYAAKGDNIEYLGLSNDPRYKFFLGDVSNKDLVEEVFSQVHPDLVFNFAAESHVDRSIQYQDLFVLSNILGTANLLGVSSKLGLERFVQISTDEVYGSKKEGSFVEEDKLTPSSTYSATKAAAEHLVTAYHTTENTPTLITRSSNNYGKLQFPEKLIPLFITNLLEGEKVPLMWSEDNPGLNIRDWIHVEDNCRAIWHVAKYGKVGEAYNISGNSETDNLTITRSILSYFGYGEDMIEKVPHRKGHDFRYSISGEKLKNLGFEYIHPDLNQGLSDTCRWYAENSKWWSPLKAK